MPTTTAQPGTSADVCTAAVTTTPPPDSKALQRCAYWLVSLDRVACEHALLNDFHSRYIRRKRPNVAEADAIWAGVWALRMDMEHRIEHIRDRGGLLFVGSGATLARALELEGGAA